MKHICNFTFLFALILAIHQIFIVECYLQIGMDIFSVDSGDEHATAIGISNDGNFVAVGSPHAGTPDLPDSGEVKIYQAIKNGIGETTWEQLGNTLVGKQAGAHLGISVAL